MSYIVARLLLARVVLTGKSEIINLDHPLRYIPSAMQYAPDINVFWTFNVKNEVRIACKLPKAQTGQIQCVRTAVAMRTRSRRASK